MRVRVRVRAWLLWMVIAQLRRSGLCQRTHLVRVRVRVRIRVRVWVWVWALPVHARAAAVDAPLEARGQHELLLAPAARRAREAHARPALLEGGGQQGWG